MQYSLANQSHLTQLAQCRWALWVEDGEHQAVGERAAFIQSFVDWLSPKLSRDWHVWCAHADGMVLAHLYIQTIAKVPKPSAPQDQFGYVTNAYTRPAYRGKGIGRALIKEAQSWALRQNMEFLVLWPGDASVELWQSEGFAATDALVHSIRPYIN